MILSRTELRSADVALHYDELDHFYREIWGEHVHHGFWERGDETPDEAALQLARCVIGKAGIQPGAQVCDVGSGYGATARLLASRFGAQVTAMTVSEAQYTFARSVAGAPGNPEYILGDWLRNSLAPDRFDCLIAIESSEHMPDKKAFFREAARVLRPGGRAVICAWLSAENPSRLKRDWLLEPICRESRMPGIGTETDYRALFAEAGMAVSDFQDISASVRKTWPICIRRFLVNLIRSPSYLRFLFNRHRRNRVFALTILRIWIAYLTGAMRYGVFTGVKTPVQARDAAQKKVDSAAQQS